MYVGYSDRRIYGLFAKQEGLIDKFDMDLWSSLVDYATVYAPENIVFTFVNGAEIKALQNHGRTGRWELNPVEHFQCISATLMLL